MPLSRAIIAVHIAAEETRDAAPTPDEMGAAASSSYGGGGPTEKTVEAEQSREDEENVFVSLTYEPLDATRHMARVKSAKAGAVVLFAGCTRDSFNSQPVTHLSYAAYAPLALQTLSRIAQSIKNDHGLTAIAITHRLGRVDAGDESILIAIASPHRQAAWKAGEQCLEDVKRSAEIWKKEWFQDGGVWRSNRDGPAGVPVRRASTNGAELATRREDAKERRDSDEDAQERRDFHEEAKEKRDFHEEAKEKRDSHSKGTEARDSHSKKGTEGREFHSKGTERREFHSKGKERKASDAKERLPSRRKSSAAAAVQIGIKKAATTPVRPNLGTRTTTFYEGGLEI